MTTDRWTHAEEAELKRLMERKNKLYEQNIHVLERLVSSNGLSSEDSQTIAERLADNADAFRDALEPFDSGVRMK